MAGLLGRPGSWGGLVLRVGQTFFAAACIGVMCIGGTFAQFTALSYLIASMGLQMVWSFGLACLDGYAVFANENLTSPIPLSMFVVGDWITAILSLGASSASAGLMILFRMDIHFCRATHYSCGIYELGTAFGFLSWALSATSALIMFWLLAAL